MFVILHYLFLGLSEPRHEAAVLIKSSISDVNTAECDGFTCTCNTEDDEHSSFSDDRSYNASADDESEHWECMCTLTKTNNSF